MEYNEEDYLSLSVKDIYLPKPCKNISSKKYIDGKIHEEEMN